MNKIKIIISLASILLLFGCSQAQKDNNDTDYASNVTPEKSVTATANEEKSTLKQSVSDSFINDLTARSSENQQSSPSTTALPTNQKATAAPSEASTAEYTPSGSSDNVFSYVKKGNMFYIDDKKFTAGQSDYHGIAFPGYFLTNGISLNKITVNFTYGDKDWLIVSSKGVYGYETAGGETAVMTAQKGTGFSGEEKYYVPAQNDWLKMQIECFDENNQQLFRTDFESHWWANGYIRSEIKNSENISVKNRIAFKDEEMAKKFVSELDKNGLKAVSGEQELAQNSYFISGNEVYYRF